MKKGRNLVGVLLGLGAFLVVTGTAYGQPQPPLMSWSEQIPDASQRFVVLSSFNNKAVLDKETGLVWEQLPIASRRVFPLWDWFEAHRLCRNKNVGGRKGWRLPAIEELTSLVDPNEANPTLPNGHPFDNVQNNYWSATTDPANMTATPPGAALTLNFFNGNVSLGDKDANEWVWCVRGGQGFDGLQTQ